VLCLTGCAAAVAFAGNRAPNGADEWDNRSSRPGPRPMKPLITLHPTQVTVSTVATLGFRLPRGHARFVCSIDGGHAKRCRSPLRIQNLGAGAHRFRVSALGRRGRRGRPARFRWEVVEPRPFGVTARFDGLRSLYPGAAPVELPLTIENPNPEAIRVVALQVSVPGGPPGCDPTENLVLTASSASEVSPLVVPPGGTAELPGIGISAPSIQLRDLPTNQNACQGGQFELRFEGVAHG
jgi:hypothetical protein